MDLRRRKLRVTFFFLTTIGLLIVCISVLAYNIISRELTGVRSPVEAALGWLPFYEPERVRGVRAAVLQSEQTARHMMYMAPADVDPEEIRESYLAISRFWKNQLLNRRIRTDIISDEELITHLDDYNLLILPAVYCMSDRQIAAVKNFLAQQKGVVMTHVTGNRNANGEERGWSLTKDITGGKPFYMEPGEGGHKGRLLFLAGENPVSTDLPPAFPLRILTHDHPISLVLRENRTHSSAVWQAPGSDLPGTLRRQTGIAYGDYMGGRFVWFGFTIQSVPPEAELWSILDRMINNACNWAGWRSVGGRAPWPATRAAATFGIMADSEPPRPDLVREIFQPTGLRPALIFPENNASLNHIPLGQLRGQVEYAPGIAANPESLTEDGFTGAMLQRAQTAGHQLDRLLEAGIQGFSLPVRPKSGLYQLDRSGFDFIWISSDDHYPVPELTPAGSSGLFGRWPHPPVIISPSARSDLHLIHQDEISGRLEILKHLNGDLDRVRQLGGLYSMTFHTRLLNDREFGDLIRDWVASLNDPDLWMASPSEVADWWRMYENVQVSFSQEGRRVTLRVSNEGAETVPQIRLLLYPALMPEGLDIRAERMRTPIPDYVFDHDHNRIELIIGDLRRRENRTYYIDL